MKIFVLGASGMAGEMITNYLSKNTKHEIFPICRTPFYCDNLIFDAMKQTDMEILEYLISEHKPDVIINCIGILVKESQMDPVKAFHINTNLPRKLAEICTEVGCKLIHISTDCVFDGKNGPYSETDTPTESNMYGTSKAYGEITTPPHLTLRTSIIGPDSDPDGTGLFNWFIKQTGTIKGYSEVQWNGITTLELAKQIEKILKHKFELSGLYHLTTDYPISKFNLLYCIKFVYELKMKIEEDASVVSNKCLINNRKAEYHASIPPIPQQIKDLYEYHL